MDLSQFKTVEQLAAAIKTMDMVTSVAWTDYSGTSTVEGWSSFTNKKIFYKKVGKLVFVKFQITGTSSQTYARFSLPFSIAAGVHVTVAIQVQDNGTTQATSGLLQSSTPPTSTMLCYKRIDALPFLNSGVKGVIGEFFYEAA